MTAQTTRSTAAHAAEIGPRLPGGRYRSYFWQQGYTVLAVEPAREDWMHWSVTVRWDDGRVGTHCTAWDADRDQVLAEPPAVPAQPAGRE